MASDAARGSTVHLTAAQGSSRIAPDAEARSVPLFEHGTLLVKFYAPRGIDAQTPHTRDEVYVVAQGRAIFFDGASRRECNPGDLLFAAAGLVHRFESMSEDFGVWVLFYGPEGGERA